MNLPPDVVPLRSPAQVMRLQRLGSFHQTRLSFMRTLVRETRQQQWRFSRPLWKINNTGVGCAVYQMTNGERVYSLAVYAHDLPPEKRSDRVIADAWDATFSLCEGLLSLPQAEAMRHDVSRQEGGRQCSRQLVLSRANRSVRLFSRVVEALAQGQQPAVAELDDVGYLMRTTAVYGNGKFGIAEYADRRAPFRAELLAVWMFREFTLDLAEHLAQALSPQTAISLSAANRRRLGIGNSTGLGMAPFLINHQALLHQWILAREKALARVRAAAFNKQTRESFIRTIVNAQTHVDNWLTSDERQQAKIITLQKDLKNIITFAKAVAPATDNYWDFIYRWGEQTLGVEGQEMLLSLLIEPHGALVDELADEMAIDEKMFFRIPAQITVKKMRLLVEEHYAWALAVDFSKDEENARFWYVSADKMEPRLGECATEAGVDLQLPLAVARDVSSLNAALASDDDNASLADFLLRFPQHRHSVRRVHIAQQCQYAEIRDNVVAAQLIPIDILRCKLSFFGATKFDPHSDRWLRITMFQNAPPPGATDDGEDNWAWAPLPVS